MEKKRAVLPRPQRIREPLNNSHFHSGSKYGIIIPIKNKGGASKMKQETFTDIEYNFRKKKTKREKFLEIMDEIIP